jgi:hypothetical protein
VTLDWAERHMPRPSFAVATGQPVCRWFMSAKIVHGSESVQEHRIAALKRER